MQAREQAAVEDPSPRARYPPAVVHVRRLDSHDTAQQRVAGLGDAFEGHLLECDPRPFVDGDGQTEASVGFVRLVWAALVGYLVFAEVPDAWTWLGGIMIFACTAYIAYGERRR